MARGKSPSFETQRGLILETAARLFAAQGFHNTSMADLAKACGVSKALLYHYYRAKEDILFDIADSYIDRLLSIIDTTDEEFDNPKHHLMELVARFMMEYDHSQNQHMVLVQDVKFLQANQADTVAGKQRQVVNAFAELVEQIEPGLKARHLDKPITMILFGMINWTFTWFKTEGELKHADMSTIVTHIFLDGLRNWTTWSPIPLKTPEQ